LYQETHKLHIILKINNQT